MATATQTHSRHIITLGHKVGNTSNINADLPLLEIGESSGAGLVLEHESEIIPEKLTLSVEVKPVPIVGAETKISLIKMNKVCSEQPLYYDIERSLERSLCQKSCYKKIKFIYRGEGSYQLNQENFFFKGRGGKNFLLQISEDNCLYIKSYRIETQKNILQEVIELPQEKILTSPPGAVNKRVLRPYGVLCDPYRGLEYWKQTYYEIVSNFTNDKTKFNFFASSIPEDSVCFPQPSHEERLSVRDLILNGSLELFILIKKRGLRIGFKSYSYTALTQNHLLNIVFIPA